jgi:peroxiredoxin Q/BCP
MSFRAFAAAITLGLAAPVVSPGVEAQEPSPPLEVGAQAPDFALPGATRHGVLAEPVRLSDYRGKTVVLAFFFRARTRG